MPGLLRGMAKTAAVVGTATATRNAVSRRQAEKNVRAYSNAVDSTYAQQGPPPPQYAQQPQQYAPPAPELYAQPPLQQYSSPPPQRYASAPAPEEDMIAQLERLGALRAQGILTDEEFAAAKQRLLAA
ncbi:MAG: SHOCT domain-containing protein [Chloroflexales bacterium]|nr:SHOCT domain-containing protein [Chloroflexales bacterium]